MVSSASEEVQEEDSTIITAHLVEEQTESAKDEETNRLKRELEELKEQKRYHEQLNQEEAVVMVVVPSTASSQGRQEVASFERHQVTEGLKVDEPKIRATKKLLFGSLGQRFGRESEISKLRMTFERMVKDDNDDDDAGKKQLVQIGGVSGSGKSTLALQVKSVVAAHKKGCCLSGKFDPNSADPHAAIGSAFEGLCQALLVHKSSGAARPAGINLEHNAFVTEFHKVADNEDLDFLVLIMPSLCG